MRKSVIIIPARYDSIRFPGKPLAKIAGKEMLLRVWEIANIVINNISNVEAYVATDDERIEVFCKENSINYIMTSPECATGTDRIVEAVSKLDTKPDFIINMQGDNPLCPPWFVEELIKTYNEDNSIEVVTPAVNLTWKALDRLIENKKTTPFSGTCVTMDKAGYALYFSKNIIPAIRKEEKHRKTMDSSPVYRQPGLYGYRIDVLEKVPTLEKGYYEDFEGLEQLRFMENGIKVKCVKTNYKDREDLAYMSGIDSPEDVFRAEKLFKKYGEFSK